MTTLITVTTVTLVSLVVVALVGVVMLWNTALTDLVFDRPRVALRALRSGVKATELGEFGAACRLWRHYPVDDEHRSVLVTVKGKLIVDRRAFEFCTVNLNRRHRPADLTTEAIESLVTLAAQTITREGVEPFINIDSGKAHWDMNQLGPAALLDFHRQALTIIAQSWSEHEARQKQLKYNNDELQRVRLEKKRAAILAEAGESLRLNHCGADRAGIVQKTISKREPTAEGKS